MKHGRPESEVHALAESLRGTRLAGTPIDAWLDLHHPGLQALIPAGWKWDQVAQALNEAGIRYGANKPRPGGKTSRGAWTGLQLQRAVKKARARAAKRAGVSLPQLFEDAPKAAERAAVEALTRGIATGTSARCTSSREAVQRVAAPPAFPPPEDAPQPAPRKVRVIGGFEPEPPKKLTPLERMQEEKLARTRAIMAEVVKKGG